MRLGSALIICLAIASEAAAQSSSAILGTWRRSLSGSGQFEEMAISQSGDTVTVRRILVDSATQKLLTTSTALYLIGRDWTGSFENPPGSTITTTMSWGLGGQVLQLSAIVRAPRAPTVTIFEVLQVGPGNQLRRNVRESDVAEGKIRNAKTDMWTRVT
jgi:hypothetical protein